IGDGANSGDTIPVTTSAAPVTSAPTTPITPTTTLLTAASSATETPGIVEKRQESDRRKMKVIRMKRRKP
ncbi:1203_t:CDS:1, partial [Acaulospora morrowiae]